MIRINLIGVGGTKSISVPNVAAASRGMPILLVLIVAGTIAGGYLWHASLTAAGMDLDSSIVLATAQKAELDEVIKQSQHYEVLKKDLENRIRVIEGLKRNQVNPVLALDVLSDAIQRTEYVWLSQLDQNNAILSMSGTGTSINAIADFVANLQSTGYFRNPDLANATDSAGNFTFSLKCEFTPPPPRNMPVGGN